MASNLLMCGVVAGIAVLASCTSDGEQSLPTVAASTTTVDLSTFEEPAELSNEPPPEPDRRTALDAARALWETERLADYELTFTVQRPTNPGVKIVTVVGGEAVAVVDQVGAPQPFDFDGFFTVDNFFSFVDGEIDTAARLQVAYDPVYGVPIFIDHLGAGADEADALRVQNVSMRPLALTPQEQRELAGGVDLESTLEARAKWDAWRSGVANERYVVTFDAQCAVCDNRGGQQITVIDGVPNESPSTGIGQTVDAWFDFIQFVLPHAERLEVTFDAEIGIPATIVATINGDEFSVAVSDVAPLEQP